MNRQLWIGAVILSCFVAAAAATQAPPAPGPPRDFVLPATQEVALDNGLAASLVEFGAIPKATLSLVVRVGNLNEGADEVWLADLVGKYLNEGSVRRSAEELARAAASMGGELEVNTGMDQTSISIDVLSEFVPEAVELLAEVVREPAFQEADHQRLLADMERALSLGRADPGQAALAEFRSALYGNHPYGRLFPDDEEAIRRLGNRDVRDFHAANFGAARTRLYVVGRFDAEAAGAAVRSAFADWQAGPPPLMKRPDPAAVRSVHVVDRPDASQSNIRIGLPVMDSSQPDAIPMQVLNTMLGGFFSSRITTNIREDKGYTYSPYSAVSNRYRDAYWVQVANVSTAVTGATLKEILYEVQRLRDEPPEPAELAGVQAFMTGVFVLQNSSRAGIAAQLANIDLHGLGADYLSSYVSRVNAVTPEDIQRVANGALDPAKMTIAVAGDREAIAGQLTPFGTLVD